MAWCWALLTVLRKRTRSTSPARSSRATRQVTRNGRRRSWTAGSKPPARSTATRCPPCPGYRSADDGAGLEPANGFLIEAELVRQNLVRMLAGVGRPRQLGRHLVELDRARYQV